MAGSRLRRRPLRCVIRRQHAIILSLWKSNTACLLTRTLEPRQSQRYGVGGSSAFRNVCADAIAKSSTSLRNSVSLNSRMLAYAAATRSARTRALRSCVILISAMCTDSRVINPPSSGLNFKSRPNITPDKCAAQTTHGFLKIASSQETKAARNSHLPKDTAQTQKFAIHGKLGRTNVSIVSKLANLSIRSSVGLVSGFSPRYTRAHPQTKGDAIQTNPTNTSLPSLRGWFCGSIVKSGYKVARRSWKLSVLLRCRR
jgi:hypothetical protein